PRFDPPSEVRQAPRGRARRSEEKACRGGRGGRFVHRPAAHGPPQRTEPGPPGFDRFEIRFERMTNGKGTTAHKTAQPMSQAAQKESERKRQQLISMGKAKGYLTYDEVNDHLPDDIVSSDQIDDWLSSLGDEGIEIVDAGAQVKLPAAAAA